MSDNNQNRKYENLEIMFPQLEIVKQEKPKYKSNSEFYRQLNLKLDEVIKKIINKI